MNRKDNQFYYAPHRDLWGVYQHHDDGSGHSCGTHIDDYPTREAARREVFRLNGWTYKPQK